MSLPLFRQALFRQALFRNGLAGTAKLRREVLQLWQAVSYGQHRLGIIDVNAWGEGKRWNGGSEHVHEAQRRMVGHQMPAALRAILTLAKRRLLERGHVF